MEYNQYINHVELQGIVGTSRVSDLGEKNAVSFSLATNYAFKDREGCHVIETTWHNCTSFVDKEDDLSIYDKGTPLHIEGRLRNLRYTDACGCERTTIEVVVSKVRRLEP